MHFGAAGHASVGSTPPQPDDRARWLTVSVPSNETACATRMEQQAQVSAGSHPLPNGSKSGVPDSRIFRYFPVLAQPSHLRCAEAKHFRIITAWKVPVI